MAGILRKRLGGARRHATLRRPCLLSGAGMTQRLSKCDLVSYIEPEGPEPALFFPPPPVRISPLPDSVVVRLTDRASGVRHARTVALWALGAYQAAPLPPLPRPGAGPGAAS